MPLLAPFSPIIAQDPPPVTPFFYGESELTIEDGCDKIGIYADVVELVDLLDLGAVT
jgi:hypothetical protein